MAYGGSVIEILKWYLDDLADPSVAIRFLEPCCEVEVHRSSQNGNRIIVLWRNPESGESYYYTFELLDAYNIGIAEASLSEDGILTIKWKYDLGWPIQVRKPEEFEDIASK